MKKKLDFFDAMKYGDLHLMKIIYSKDPSIDVNELVDGENLLYTAIDLYSKYDMIKFIFECGADPNVMNEEGYTPFTFFC